MTDVLIVGAGPAGLSAAATCARHGLSVRVVDEFMKPGGRLLGQLHEEPDGTWWNGIEEARRLYEQAVGLGASVACGVSVYDAARGEEGWVVSTTEGILEAPVLLLATGAAETALPLPGWTIPGVMSIGAAQVMTNVHRVRVGERGVIIGVNILAVAIARELQLAGIHVDRMVLPPRNPVTQEAASPYHVMQSLLRVAHLAPSAFIRYGSRLVKSDPLLRLAVRCYPAGGVKMWRMPIHLRTAAVEILGTSKVEGVRLARVSPDGEPLPGTEHDIPADFVCIAGGLHPLAELAAVAGCPFAYLPELGGHVPLHNERMETPLAGLYVAGNITGIESAKVAMAQGAVAGLAIAEHLGRLRDRTALADAIAHVKRVRRSATIQFHPEIGRGRADVERMFQEQGISGK
ncbi:FAD-dependent oxidoreductase [Brevibacillus sp. SYP-B805]|uniref:NAD(P)/FAD-dependent oxidoreductase n=1 Tax=Brevibacillus sp. SYP-B805 TaxID=1578199 RepID=UPI0013EC2894|nr:NAD(P)/FAD-dependent oxidoreductase [Brevibacillus sp. SYP-B805]NGQ97448.1 FAD-dependent oxidoreductase [Brevibacillus sp. SYP-B805]